MKDIRDTYKDLDAHGNEARKKYCTHPAHALKTLERGLKCLKCGKTWRS